MDAIKSILFSRATQILARYIALILFVKVGMTPDASMANDLAYAAVATACIAFDHFAHGKLVGAMKKRLSNTFSLNSVVLCLASGAILAGMAGCASVARTHADGTPVSAQENDLINVHESYAFAEKAILAAIVSGLITDAEYTAKIQPIKKQIDAQLTEADANVASGNLLSAGSIADAVLTEIVQLQADYPSLALTKK